jgi:hypothetical protein
MKEFSSPEKRGQDAESNEVRSEIGNREAVFGLFRNPGITPYEVAHLAGVLLEESLDLPKDEIHQLVIKLNRGNDVVPSANPEPEYLSPDHRRDLLINSCAEIVTNPATRLTLAERQDAIQDATDRVYECFEEEFGEGGKLHSLRLSHASHSALRRQFDERRNSLETALEDGQLTDEEADSAELALQAINESAFSRWTHKFKFDKD